MQQREQQAVEAVVPRRQTDRGAAVIEESHRAVELASSKAFTKDEADSALAKQSRKPRQFAGAILHQARQARRERPESFHIKA